MYPIIWLISVVVLAGCSTTGSLHSNSTVGGKHTETVYFVANNLPDGSNMRWHDNPTHSYGMVRVVMTENYGGSYCRLLDSTIRKRDKQWSIQEYACTNDNGNTWEFHPYR